MKICTKCKIEKEESEFYKKKNSFEPWCKLCKHLYKKQYHARTYKTKKRILTKTYNKTCTLCNIKFLTKVHNSKFCCVEHKNTYWYSNNKQHAKNINKEYSNKRRNSDPQFRLRVNLRNRLRGALKGTIKYSTTMELVGCSREELRIHLESKFQENMTWENYGTWHVDHIIPFAFFDLSDPEQLKKACHYTNLQPLWAKDNLSKGDKII